MEPKALTQNFFHDIKDALLTNATVNTVFGEPIKAGDRTIIPVARVAYGFGGGSGTSRAGRGGDGAGIGGEGGGGGGGVAALPVGVVEVSPTGTHFVSVSGRKRMAAFFLAGLLLGRLLRRR